MLTYAKLTGAFISRKKMSCDQRYLVNFKSSLAFKAKVIIGRKARKGKITFFAKETLEKRTKEKSKLESFAILM